MSSDSSYTLREVAELLGVSKRALQRRIQEGAFPNRYLAPGRNGLETRIPAADVERVLDDIRRHGRERRAVSVRPGAVDPNESLIPAYDAAPVEHISSVPPPSVDLEVVRETMLSAVREEREMFLAAVRSALTLRDREIATLREEMTEMRSAMEEVRRGVDRLGHKLRANDDALSADAWFDALAPAADAPLDVDAILHELGELESMLGVLPD